MEFHPLLYMIGILGLLLNYRKAYIKL